MDAEVSPFKDDYWLSRGSRQQETAYLHGAGSEGKFRAESNTEVYAQ